MQTYMLAYGIPYSETFVLKNAIDPITGEPLPMEGEMDTLGDVPLEPDGAITNGQLGKDTKKAEI